MSEMLTPTIYTKTPYYQTAKATDLSGGAKFLYRLFEILPATLSWGTLFGAAIISYFYPFHAAIFIIIFDAYWLSKTVYLSLHLLHNWRRIKFNMKVPWYQKLRQEFDCDHLHHLVLVPFYREDKDVVGECVESVKQNTYDKSKIHVVLAYEERAGEESRVTARFLEEKYKNVFASLTSIAHPSDVVGELAGKGSNIAHAGRKAKELLDSKGIIPENVIVSALDCDTRLYPEYLACVTWNFLRAPDPYRASYQPVPFYHNNIWQVPVVSRVVAGSATFWQMIEQEREEHIVTFSSHSMSLKALIEADFWQKNAVSEDSRIFWNMYFAFDGNYKVVPISYPISMDANAGTTLKETFVNIYKQQRRWMWGVENIPYILMNFLNHPKIPFRKKLYHTIVQLEGFWSLATNPLMIMLLGWLPVLLGGRIFTQSVLAYNLPHITQFLMVLAMCGLFFSALVYFSFVPPRPLKEGARAKKLSKGFSRYVVWLQWFLVPFTIVIFGAIPGLDAQTRLMLGKYMGYWVTPKRR